MVRFMILYLLVLMEGEYHEDHVYLPDFDDEKVGTAAFTIMAAEQLWSHGHKVKAISLMVITNTAMMAVAHHNYRIVSRMR